MKIAMTAAPSWHIFSLFLRTASLSRKPVTLYSKSDEKQTPSVQKQLLLHCPLEGRQQSFLLHYLPVKGISSAALPSGSAPTGVEISPLISTLEGVMTKI